MWVWVCGLECVHVWMCVDGPFLFLFLLLFLVFCFTHCSMCLVMAGLSTLSLPAVIISAG